MPAAERVEELVRDICAVLVPEAERVGAEEVDRLPARFGEPVAANVPLGERVGRTDARPAAEPDPVEEDFADELRRAEDSGVPVWKERVPIRLP